METSKLNKDTKNFEIKKPSLLILSEGNIFHGFVFASSTLLYVLTK